MIADWRASSQGLAAVGEFDPAYGRIGSILLKKDFERGLRATLIQGERRTSNIDSKLHLLGFDCFKLSFHSFILETFSTLSVKMRRTRIEHMSAGLPLITDIALRGWHGSFVPIADSFTAAKRSLFDHSSRSKLDYGRC